MVDKIAVFCLLSCILAPISSLSLTPSSLTTSIEELLLNFELNPNFERFEAQPLVKCTNSSSCDGGQICNLGRCQCPNPMEQYFFYSRSTCEVDAGRPCNPEGDIPCTKSSSCLPDPMSRTGFSCLCDKDREIDGFYCVQRYRGACTRTCYWFFCWDDCNYTAGQTCEDNRCECLLSPDQIYDPTQKRCVARLNYPCTTIDVGWYSCATNAYCAKSQFPSQTPVLGVCRLKE